MQPSPIELTETVAIPPSIGMGSVPILALVTKPIPTVETTENIKGFFSALYGNASGFLTIWINRLSKPVGSQPIS